MNRFKASYRCMFEGNNNRRANDKYVELDHPELEIAAHIVLNDGDRIHFEYVGNREALLACGVANSYMFDVYEKRKCAEQGNVDEYGVYYRIQRYANDVWRLIFTPEKEFANPNAGGRLTRKKERIRCFKDVDISQIIEKYSSKTIKKKRQGKGPIRR